MKIINSILDNDLYSLTVGQIAFKYFFDKEVEYTFINRGGTKFPDGFDNEFKRQLDLMKDIRLSIYEHDWLRKLNYFDYDYLIFLINYRFDPSEVTINQNKNGELFIKIKGNWVRTIMWEVPLLALISELYYKLTNKEKDGEWISCIERKAQNLSKSGCLWMDFGTRRRFSFQVQNKVVSTMKGYKGFLGTSNMVLTFNHNITSLGSMSHQGPMAMMGLYGVENANKEWMNIWKKHYDTFLSIYLCDTFTTKYFLKNDFNTKEKMLKWEGLRQDSSNPFEWMEMVINHYKKHNVSIENKKFIFSDSLTDETYKELSLKYRKYATIIGGIGTNFSNDCGHKPLSIVIKLSSINEIDVVKLSDNPAKNTGNIDLVYTVKTSLKNSVITKTA